ncbi:MAG TPA: pilus assembly protein [Myxococcota bacterium]|nr:pilus assembly protein [Myxococcota bacterium]
MSRLLLSPRSRRGSRRGIAAVEFALTLPVTALILIGTLEFGWYFSRLVMVNSATYDAARLAAFEDNSTDAVVTAEAAVTTLLADMGMDCGALGCAIDADRIDVDGLPMVELSVSVPYAQLTGIIPGHGVGGRSFDAPTLLNARAVMPIVGP